MRKRRCQFCKNNQKVIDFRSHSVMHGSISGWAKIKTRRDTNCCPGHQRQLAEAILRARFMALIPYTSR